MRLGHGSPVETDAALALARQLAMTTYRGSEEFSRRFAAGPELRDGRFHFPVEDYLEHAGRALRRSASSAERVPGAVRIDRPAST